jgi:hypothetical protein
MPTRISLRRVGSSTRKLMAVPDSLAKLLSSLRMPKNFRQKREKSRGGGGKGKGRIKVRKGCEKGAIVRGRHEHERSSGDEDVPSPAAAVLARRASRKVKPLREESGSDDRMRKNQRERDDEASSSEEDGERERELYKKKESTENLTDR